MVTSSHCRDNSPHGFAGWHRPIDLLLVHGASANPQLRLDLAFSVPLVRPGDWICGEGYVDEFADL